MRIRFSNVYSDIKITHGQNEKALAQRILTTAGSIPFKPCIKIIEGFLPQELLMAM